MDRGDDLVRRFRERKLDALNSVGGDGWLTIARQLHEKGLRGGQPTSLDRLLGLNFGAAAVRARPRRPMFGPASYDQGPIASRAPASIWKA